jgi:hypothetical protein
MPNDRAFDTLREEPDMDDPSISTTAETRALELELTRDLQSEDARVQCWRLAQFLGLGFGLDEATELAGSGADTACARRLVAQGCSRELAARILI